LSLTRHLATTFAGIHCRITSTIHIRETIVTTMAIVTRITVVAMETTGRVIATTRRGVA
jgi:hypothetical protein